MFSLISNFECILSVKGLYSPFKHVQNLLKPMSPCWNHTANTPEPALGKKCHEMPGFWTPGSRIKTKWNCNHCQAFFLNPCIPLYERRMLLVRARRTKVKTVQRQGLDQIWEENPLWLNDCTLSYVFLCKTYTMCKTRIGPYISTRVLRCSYRCPIFVSPIVHMCAYNMCKL